MTKLPYLPLFFGDFLASTSLWRGEQRALALLLDGHQWVSGPLPLDLDELADVIGYDRKTFAKLWLKVSTRFIRTDAGWINAELEEVRAKAKQVSHQRSLAGAKGGRPKKQPDIRLLKPGESKQKPNAFCLVEQTGTDAVKHPIQSNPNPGEEV